MKWLTTIRRGIAAAENVDRDRLAWDSGYGRNVVGFLRAGDVAANLDPGPSPIYPEPMQRRLGERRLKGEELWRSVNSTMRAIARTCNGCASFKACTQGLVDISRCPNRARFETLREHAAA